MAPILGNCPAIPKAILGKLHNRRQLDLCTKFKQKKTEGAREKNAMLLKWPEGQPHKYNWRSLVVGRQYAFIPADALPITGGHWAIS